MRNLLSKAASGPTNAVVGIATSVLWFIGEIDNASGEALCLNKLQCGGVILPEDLLPLSDNKRKDRESEGVDQVVLEQRLCEKASPINEEIVPFLLLEFSHVSDHIASNDGRIVPV